MLESINEYLVQGKLCPPGIPCILRYFWSLQVVIAAWDMPVTTFRGQEYHTRFYNAQQQNIRKYHHPNKNVLKSRNPMFNELDLTIWRIHFCCACLHWEGNQDNLVPLLLSTLPVEAPLVASDLHNSIMVEGENAVSPLGKRADRQKAKQCSKWWVDALSPLPVLLPQNYSWNLFNFQPRRKNQNSIIH